MYNLLARRIRNLRFPLALTGKKNFLCVRHIKMSGADQTGDSGGGG